MQNVIIKVEKGSIADREGIKVGDILLDINGYEISDIFDYRYLIQDEYIEICTQTPDGEENVYGIEKDPYEDLGIVFDKALMDNAKSCKNKCIFCFIDQLPKGMRKTLYFKDDDSRLSFLHGNYVTLTNMKEDDLERIIFYHFSPINISVHTIEPELRKFMLKNPNAVKIKDYLNKLYNAGIEMNFQIVLCPEINDGEHLDKTIEELGKFIPRAKSLSVVPFGMTKYRENLCPIKIFTKEQSQKVIKQVEKWQSIFKAKYNKRFVYVSDEFYLNAEMPMPEADIYEGFAQLENGVGMMTLMEYEFNEHIKKLKGDTVKRNVSVATGKLAYDFIKALCKKIEKKFTETKINVYLIKNNFFGETITVAGLLTGKDIINTLKNKELGNTLFIPEDCLKAEDTVLLDDVDILDISKELNVEVLASSSDGKEFIEQIIRREK